MNKYEKEIVVKFLKEQQETMRIALVPGAFEIVAQNDVPFGTDPQLFGRLRAHTTLLEAYITHLLDELRHEGKDGSPKKRATKGKSRKTSKARKAAK